MTFVQLDLLWSSGAAAHSGSLRAPLQRSQPAPLAATRTGDPLDARAEFFVEQALAPRTRAAYRGDIAAFTRWCHAYGVEPLPASSATLARYLTWLAESGRKVSTVRRARIAIGIAHADAGVARPDQDRKIRMLERGMGRVYGTREINATPLALESLERIITTLGCTARDDRDRALLLLGFAGAFRCSELIALRSQDVAWHADGITVLVGQSKEDPLAAGHEVEIGRAQNPQLCVVEALKRWVTRVGQGEGPLLRRVLGERVSHQPLCARAVSRAVQQHTARLGMPGDYSSHSLRAGFATSAYARGVGLLDIQRHGRWQELRSLARYIDFDAVPGRRNPISSMC